MELHTNLHLHIRRRHHNQITIEKQYHELALDIMMAISEPTPSVSCSTASSAAHTLQQAWNVRNSFWSKMHMQITAKRTGCLSIKSSCVCSNASDGDLTLDE